MNKSQVENAVLAGVVAGQVARGGDESVKWIVIALCFTNPWMFGLLIAFLACWGAWALLKAVGRLLAKAP